MSGAMQMLLATKSSTAGFDELAWEAHASAGSGGVTLTITLNTNGTTSVSVSSGDVLDTDTTTNWYTPTTTNIGFSYWATIANTGVDVFTGTTTLTQISSALSIVLASTVESKSSQATISIFSDSGGATKVTEIILNFSTTV